MPLVDLGRRAGEIESRASRRPSAVAVAHVGGTHATQVAAPAKGPATEIRSRRNRRPDTRRLGRSQFLASSRPRRFSAVAALTATQQRTLAVPSELASAAAPESAARLERTAVGRRLYAPSPAPQKVGRVSAYYKSNERERILVDPASNHMLVSKIKPCTSKYKPLRRRDCGRLIKSVTTPPGTEHPSG